MSVVQKVFNGTMQSYSPKNVVVTSGTFLITQWNEVTVEYEADTWNFIVGCYGKTVRYKDLSTFGTITLTLPQSAAGNAYNNAQFALIDNITGLDAVLPVTISDLWGGSLHVMSEATIVKYPKATYSKKVEDRQWVLKGDFDLNIFAAASALNSFGSMFS